jgi:hypothetical protein
MNTMKILTLAGFAALSIGAGTAMAQDGGAASQDYWARQYFAQVDSVNREAPVQFGSSDRGIFASTIDTNLTDGGL